MRAQQKFLPAPHRVGRMRTSGSAGWSIVPATLPFTVRPLLKPDHARAIDRYIDYFGVSMPRSPVELSRRS